MLVCRPARGLPAHRRLLDSYIRDARRIGGHKRCGGMISASANGLDVVRRWASANGYCIHHKSRVPHALLEENATAHHFQRPGDVPRKRVPGLHSRSSSPSPYRVRSAAVASALPR
ncbi:hypothetical protein GCM10027068_20710 [Prescottella soli]